MKANRFSGVIIKVKKINDQSMDNLLYVINNSPSIIHLRFDEVILTKNAVTHLSNFMRVNNKLDSLGLFSVKFEEKHDCKKVLDSISKNTKLKTLLLHNNIYYDQDLGDSFKVLV